MNINYHIYAVKNLNTGGNPADEYPFTDDFIGHMLTVARAAVLENKLSKYHPISEANYQTIKMELTDGGETKCDDGICNRITINKVPSLIQSRRNSSIRVTDLEGNTLIKTSLLRNKTSAYSLYPNKDQVKWYFSGGKIIVVGAKLLDCILVHGLFEDVIETCEGVSGECVKDFPIDSDLVDPIYKITLDYLNRALQTGEDTTNNANADRQIKNS